MEVRIYLGQPVKLSATFCQKHLPKSVNVPLSGTISSVNDLAFTMTTPSKLLSGSCPIFRTKKAKHYVMALETREKQGYRCTHRHGNFWG